jgi:hypothetical protein
MLNSFENECINEVFSGNLKIYFDKLESAIISCPKIESDASMKQ